MSSSLPALAVTGSTGAVGGLVSRALAEVGLEQHLDVVDDEGLIRGRGA